MNKTPEAETSLGALIIDIDFRGVEEEEFHDWYDSEAIARRKAIPGFLTATRWMARDEPTRSLAVYDIEGLHVLAGDAYRAITGENLSERSRRVLGACHRFERFEANQLAPGQSASPEGAGALLFERLSVDATAENNVARWYEDVQTPLFQAVPGVLCARAFRVEVGSDTFVATYHLADAFVTDGPEWLRAAEAADAAQPPGVPTRQQVMFSPYVPKRA